MAKPKQNPFGGGGYALDSAPSTKPRSQQNSLSERIGRVFSNKGERDSSNPKPSRRRDDGAHSSVSHPQFVPEEPSLAKESQMNSLRDRIGGEAPVSLPATTTLNTRARSSDLHDRVAPPAPSHAQIHRPSHAPSSNFRDRLVASSASTAEKPAPAPKPQGDLHNRIGVSDDLHDRIGLGRAGLGPDNRRETRSGTTVDGHQNNTIAKNAWKESLKEPEPVRDKVILNKKRTIRRVGESQAASDDIPAKETASVDLAPLELPSPEKDKKGFTGRPVVIKRRSPEVKTGDTAESRQSSKGDEAASDAAKIAINETSASNERVVRLVRTKRTRAISGEPDAAKLPETKVATVSEAENRHSPDEQGGLELAQQGTLDPAVENPVACANEPVQNASIPKIEEQSESQSSLPEVQRPTLSSIESTNPSDLPTSFGALETQGPRTHQSDQVPSDKSEQQRAVPTAGGEDTSEREAADSPRTLETSVSKIEDQQALSDSLNSSGSQSAIRAIENQQSSAEPDVADLSRVDVSMSDAAAESSRGSLQLYEADSDGGVEDDEGSSDDAMSDDYEPSEGNVLSGKGSDVIPLESSEDGESDDSNELPDFIPLESSEDEEDDESNKGADFIPLESSEDEEGDEEEEPEVGARGRNAKPSVADDEFIPFDFTDSEEEAVEEEEEAVLPSHNATPDGKQKKRGILSKLAGALKVNQRGKKRAREEDDDDVDVQAPWTIGRDYSREPEVSGWLHKEVVDFIDSISPDDEQIRRRAGAVERIQKCVKRLWDDATVCVFGSYATNLYLPNSDIDLVIISQDGKYDNKSSLYQLANALKAAKIAVNVEVIAKARVPIIKFTDRTSGINIDISFERYTGVVAADTIMHWVADWPGLRELVMTVKYYIAKRGLNNVANGGLGGYAVVCLVLSFLQMHPKVASGEIRADENLGVLLIQFFELYGKNCNYDAIGICVRGKGSYFDKNRDLFLQSRGKYSLVIRDPNEPTNNISRGTYNLRNIRRAFAGAYDILTTQCYEMDALSRKRWVGRSLLSSILYKRDERYVAARYE